MDERFRSRKFFVAMLTFAVSTALLMGGYVSDAVWRDVAVMVGGAYLAANAWQNIGLSKAPRPE